MSLALHIGGKSRSNTQPQVREQVDPQNLTPARLSAITPRRIEASANFAREAGEQQQTFEPTQQHKKPRRWDKPFGDAPIPPQLIEHILYLPCFKDIDLRGFPEDLPLGDIIANDGRIIRYGRGDIVYNKGDYDNSLYIVLRGCVRSLLAPKGAQTNTGAQQTTREQPQPTSVVASCLDMVEQLQHKALNRLTAYGDSIKQCFDLFSHDKTPHSHIRDVDELIIKFPTSVISLDEIFGEFEALTRTARNNTVFADAEDTILLELRWPGARDIQCWSEIFRDHIDDLYCAHGIETGLRDCPVFKAFSERTLENIIEHCRFETYGDFGWAHRYQRDKSSLERPEQIIDHEPVIASQGDYLDDLLIIRAGFARVSEKCGESERTTGFLKAGEVFGLSEMLNSQDGGSSRMMQHSLRAMGYVDLISIPTHIVEKYLSPAQRDKLKADLPDKPASQIASPLANDTGLEQSMLDFAVDNRFVNGTMAMAINTDRCVNCDDCVRACAATHNNIPRFVRQGTSHQNLMIANACMHCTDPVCLIDCPTNAIHRDIKTGTVVIDDAACIGCASCATACPYDNIRMEGVKDSNNIFQRDENGANVLVATKCDLCTGQRSGPACQQACPHDALIRIDFQDTDKLSNWLKLTH